MECDSCGPVCRGRRAGRNGPPTGGLRRALFFKGCCIRSRRLGTTRQHKGASKKSWPGPQCSPRPRASSALGQVTLLPKPRNKSTSPGSRAHSSRRPPLCTAPSCVVGLRGSTRPGLPAATAAPLWGVSKGRTLLYIESHTHFWMFTFHNILQTRQTHTKSDRFVGSGRFSRPLPTQHDCLTQQGASRDRS